MQVNSININNNAPVFKGVTYKDQYKFLKIGYNNIIDLATTDAVNAFRHRKDYDLIITVDYARGFVYKVKSAGQGIKGFLKNLKAPWTDVNIQDFSSQVVEKYISIWHKK